MFMEGGGGGGEERERLTMEHPVSLFRVLGGNSDILFIVWRSYLWQQNSEFLSRKCLFARVYI